MQKSFRCLRLFPFFYNIPRQRTVSSHSDYAEDALRRIFGEICEIDFVGKEEVVSSKKYKSMSEGLLSIMNTTITATDYKDLRNPGKMLKGIKNFG